MSQQILSQDEVDALRQGITSQSPKLEEDEAPKGADMLIKDATAVHSHLPNWYRRHVAVSTFLVLPLQIKGAAIGLIYADKAIPGSLVLHEPELVLLRSLRDEAVAAFRRGH